MHRKIAFIVFLFTFYSLPVLFSQVYPVHLSVSTSSPYSVYLPEYGKAGTNKMQVHLSLNDPQATTLQVRLRLEVTNIATGATIRTRKGSMVTPVSFNGMSSLVLQGSDLAPYFRLSVNLIIVIFYKFLYI
jgi:hypothetical protein